MADDVSQALQAAPEAKAVFERLPPSHRNEYLTWVEEAKKPATRARRIGEMVRRLGEGK
jgi:uncharacterized protein YdeI (YjbR/CyaY-like superfamily)